MKVWKKIIGNGVSIVFAMLFMFLCGTFVYANDGDTPALDKDAQLVEDYIDHLEYSSVTAEDIVYEWHGNFEDYDVVWITSTDYPDKLKESQVVISKYLLQFESASLGNKLYVYKDHTFTKLKDAYNENVVSDEDMDAIAASLENSAWAVDIYCISKNNGLILPDDRAVEIFAQYKALTGESQLKDQEMFYEYYGTYYYDEEYGFYDTCDIVWLTTENRIDTDLAKWIQVGPYVFEFYSDSAATRFYASAGGDLYPVAEAYEKGYLFSEDVAALAEVFNETSTVGKAYLLEENDDLSLPIEQEQQLLEDYISEFPLSGVTTDDLVYECYGIYDGHELVYIDSVESLSPAVEYEMQLGKYVLNFGMIGDAKSIYLHINHTFVPIEDAYYDYLLSEKDLDVIVQKITAANGVASIEVLENKYQLAEMRESLLLDDYLKMLGDTDLSKEDLIYECYGIFDPEDYERRKVVLIDQTKYENTGGQTEITLGDYKFVFETESLAERFYVRDEGKLIDIKTAYEDGLLTDENVAWVAEQVRNAQLAISVYGEQTGRVQSDGLQEYGARRGLLLSDERDEKLYQDYMTFIKGNYPKAEFYYECYGIYNGYEAVHPNLSLMVDTDDIGHVTVGNYEFICGSGSRSRRFYLHKDGEFLFIGDAYEAGLISDEDMDQIARRVDEYSRSFSVHELEKEIELPYTDVSKDDWFYEAVKYHYNPGVMTGMTETIFGPYEQISRAQIAVILYRMHGEPTLPIQIPNYNYFEDITGSDWDMWYGPSIWWAYLNDIVTGYENGYFGPADCITREQLCVMLYRYAEGIGMDVTGKGDIDAFADAEKVSDFAVDAMKWAIGEGILTGKLEGTLLDPQGTATRAEAAVLLHRFDLERKREEIGQYELTVIGQPITEGNYIKYHRLPNYVELPVTAVFKALGAEVTWTSDIIAEITYNKNQYILDIENVSIVEEGNDENLIMPAPGGDGVHHHVYEGELLLDDISLRAVLQEMGIDIVVKVDYQNYRTEIVYQMGITLPSDIASGGFPS